MKIERKTIPEQDIAAFAEEHDLTMEITERNPRDIEQFKIERYTAKFKFVEIKNGPMLHGAYGNGQTEEEAIADYVPRISNQWLVFKAYDNDYRREIHAPRLTYRPKGDFEQ